ncbi:MAG: hypothetical protein ACWGON_03670, partial [Gemmatimonadota bacterium]
HVHRPKECEVGGSGPAGDQLLESADRGVGVTGEPSEPREDGLEVGRALHEQWLKTVPRVLAPVILLLLGLDAVLLSREVLDVVAWHGFFGGLALVAAFVALMAFRWPRRTGRIAVALVVLIPFMWAALAALNV